MRISCSVASFLLLACSAEPEPKRWESVDLAALRQAMDEPTATVEEARVNATLASLGVNLYFLWQGVEVLGWLYDAAAGTMYEPEAYEVPFDLDGTQAAITRDEQRIALHGQFFEGHIRRDRSDSEGPWAGPRL